MCACVSQMAMCDEKTRISCCFIRLTERRWDNQHYSPVLPVLPVPSSGSVVYPHGNKPDDFQLALALFPVTVHPSFLSAARHSQPRVHHDGGSQRILDGARGASACHGSVWGHHAAAAAQDRGLPLGSPESGDSRSHLAPGPHQVRYVGLSQN